MPDNDTNARLNALLIELRCSLLHYAGECRPWIDFGEEAEGEKVDGLIRRQDGQVTRLAELLYDRDWPVDFGNYPTEYALHHDVALDYLLKLLIEHEEALVAEMEDLRRTVADDDPEGAGMLEGMIDEERGILDELKTLADSQATAGAAR